MSMSGWIDSTNLVVVMTRAWRIDANILASMQWTMVAIAGDRLASALPLFLQAKGELWRRVDDIVNSVNTRTMSQHFKTSQHR